MPVSVIIPAWNEEESIGRVLAAIPRDRVEEILVIDGGSTDQTAVCAEAGSARVIQETRRGYGRACATGAEQARGEIVVFLDADGADDPRRIPDLFAPIQEGRADLVLGSRLAGRMEPGAMPWHQRAGNRLCAAMIHALYGLPITDLSPMRAVRRQALADLSMREMTFGWPTEMIVKAARRGWRIVEIPVDYHKRIGGRSKISGTVKGSLLATFDILKVIARHAWDSHGR